jgi:hypothetical protein
VALVAECTEIVVEARDLFDHTHDAGFVPVALEVPPYPFVDAFVGGRGGIRVQDHAVQRLPESLLHLGRHLTEDLFLRFEVVVEGPVREAGSLGDVGDPGIEEPVLLEHLLGCREETGPGLDPFAGTRPAGLLVRVRGRCGVGLGLGLGHERHASFRCNSNTPEGVPPPDVTTAVLASATWRAPASWRNWVTAS